METETVEEYTTRDMCEDIVKDTVRIASSYVLAAGLFVAAGYTYSKVSDFRERRAAKKNLAES